MDLIKLRTMSTLALVIFGCFVSIEAFGYQDKVLLTDVKALTLQQGHMTHGRRSSPVPQLTCVGGSAQHKFQPKVVQCKNQGSNGYDAQWECKTDMDNAYRFGHVEVTCEGFDYPDDPYVLKGSCGLEYTIELTEEGLAREKKNSGYSYSSNSNDYSTSKKSGDMGGLFTFIFICIFIYMVYKMCLAPNAQTAPTRANVPPGTAPPPPPYEGSNQPPSYGFRPEFQTQQGPPPEGPPPSYESTQGSSYASAPPPSGPYASASAPPPDCSGNAGNTGNGGFWSGAATGGVLGYLFGNSGNRRHQNRGWGNNGGWGGWGNNGGWGGWGNQNRGWGGWGNSWGSNQQQHHHHHHTNDNNHTNFFSSSSSSSRRSASPTSSGTRTASGFGGTSRR